MKLVNLPVNTEILLQVTKQITFEKLQSELDILNLEFNRNVRETADKISSLEIKNPEDVSLIEIPADLGNNLSLFAARLSKYLEKPIWIQGLIKLSNYLITRL